MTDNERIEKLKELVSDADFTEQLLDLETPEEVQAAIKEKGVDISLDEINQIKDYIIANADKEELDDEQLEQVAGGSITVGTVIGAVIVGAAIVSATAKLGSKVHEWTRGRW